MDARMKRCFPATKNSHEDLANWSSGQTYDSRQLIFIFDHHSCDSKICLSEGRGQDPVTIYFLGKDFNSVEIKYIEVETYHYALVILVRKFHPYFHAHDITFLTNQPLKHFLQKN